MGKRWTFSKNLMHQTWEWESCLWQPALAVCHWVKNLGKRKHCSSFGTKWLTARFLTDLVFYENQPRSSANGFSHGASFTISEWRQLKRISLTALGKKESLRERREKLHSRELTTRCVSPDTGDRVWSSFLVFFPLHWQLLSSSPFSPFKHANKREISSMDTISTSLLYHPCGWDEIPPFTAQSQCALM